MLEELVNLKLKCNSLSLIKVSSFCHLYNKWFPIWLHQLYILLIYLLMLLSNYYLIKMLLVRDLWQITVIMLNRFYTLIKKTHLPIVNVNIQLNVVAKSSKKDTTFCISSLRYCTSNKIHKIWPPDILFLLLYSSFSVDIS